MQTAFLKTKPQQSDGLTPRLPLRRQRLLDVDRAKALAIIFVVLGHISDPQGPEWADVLRALIYNFHMPFFMYLSGFVFVYAASHLMKRSFRDYVLTRANRLLVPFFVMAVIIITLKMLGSRYTDLNRSAASLFDAYQFILINTQQSPALDLWYLFVLFVFSIVTPLSYRLCRGRFWPLLVVSLVMYALFVDSVAAGGLTDNFYISRMCWFYVFFIAGCMACRHSKPWLWLVDRTWPFALILFVAADFGTLSVWILESPWRYLVVGLLSAVGLHGLVRSRLLASDRFLLFIAESTLSIYLFNTIFIGIARAIFVKVASPADHMLLFYVVCFPVGLAGPMLLRESLSRFPMTRPLAFYIS